MSDAPKTIWAGKYHGTFWQSTPHHQMTEYTRTDTIPSQDALIRAALEEAAETCDVATMDGVGDIIRGKGDEIRALADDPEAIARIIKAAEGRG